MIYDQIKNQKLKELVIGSVTIKRLKSADLATIIDQIARLPEQGQDELITVLEQEKQKVQMMKSLALSPENQKLLEEDLQKMVAIQKRLESEIRHEQEKATIRDETQNADALLNTL